MNPLMKLVEALKRAINPPSKMSLSEWADKHAVLSAESSAEAGRWKTLPYQKGIMDAITDPRIERVSVKKSARVGYTKILNHALAYHIHQDPCSMMVVQPTIEDAEGYSKEEIAPMLRDTPALKDLVIDAKLRDGTNSILHKLFPGGQLSLVGANSPRGFRRVSRRLVAFDETSAYPVSSGKEGSPIKLGIKRSEYFWNRKIIDGSTPGTEGTCAITRSFEEGDQRRRFLPCPHCGHSQYLKFENITWPKGEPEKAYYRCEENACVIEHSSLRWMDERGEWRATNKARNPRHASFHIWAAYSYSPNSTWADIAKEFLDCKDDPELFKTFVNTVMGETWEEPGEKPDHMRLFERREHYGFNYVPDSVAFLTAGADVQKDRIEIEIVGWGKNKESWSIDYRIIMGETHTKTPWLELNKILSETWVTEDGREMQLRMLAVDSGFATQHVYEWVRTQSEQRVRAIKGSDTSKGSLFGHPTDIDLRKDGSKLKRATKLWSVSSSMIKSELYAWLRLDAAGDDGIYPPGFCHFPEYNEDYFRGLCSEQLVTKYVNGQERTHWKKVVERNEALDCRVYARAAAAMLGMDRLKDHEWNSFYPQVRTATSAKPDPNSRSTPTPRRTPGGDDYMSRLLKKGNF